MSSRIKYIIGELNKSPFNKHYSLISFDSLGPEDLLQVLSDVLSTIEKSGQKIDVRREDPEDTTIRLLTMLRVLRYDPGPEPAKFRAGLVGGEKQTIHPILEWLLTNRKDLETRAYLAKFLVKLDIPMDMMADSDIAQASQQYERLIEEFKEVHKEHLALSSRVQAITEMRSDIEAMEREKEAVSKRIERMARKLELHENPEILLEAVHRYRLERERFKELTQEKEELRGLLDSLQEKIGRLSEEQRTLRAAQGRLTPEGVIQRLEEEVRMKEYLVEEKLENELALKRKELEVLKRPAATHHTTIQNLESQLERVTQEVNDLIQENINDGGEERQLGSFRQQATIIRRRKEETAERYGEAKAQLEALQEQLKEKGGEGRVLTEEEFKEYVSKLKVRSTLYKAKRSQLASLVAESGVLARTIDILNSKIEETGGPPGQEWDRDIEGVLEGPKETVDSSRLAELSKDELVQLVNGLNAKISAQRAKIIPIMSELKTLKEEHNELLEDYTEKKKIYDATAATLDTQTSKLQQEVKELKKEQEKCESERVLLIAKTDIANTFLHRAQEEFKNYAEKGSSNSLREKLLSRINEKERINKELREEQKLARESQEKMTKQRDLWNNLQRLLEVKEKCMEKQKQRDGVMTREEGAETLVLQ